MDALTSRFSAQRPEWIGETLRGVRRDGYAVVEHAIPPQQVERIQAAMYELQARIHADVGEQRLGAGRCAAGPEDRTCPLADERAHARQRDRQRSALGGVECVRVRQAAPGAVVRRPVSRAAADWRSS